MRRPWALGLSSRLGKAPVQGRRHWPVRLGAWPLGLDRTPVLWVPRPRSCHPAILDECWTQVGGTWASNQRERGVDLLAQDAEHVGCSLFAERREPVKRCASQQHRACAERQGLHHVGAAPKTAVDQKRAVDPGGKIGELLDRRRDVLQLASAVIGDDDAVDAQLNATLSIFGAQQAFDY